MVAKKGTKRTEICTKCEKGAKNESEKWIFFKKCLHMSEKSSNFAAEK